MAQLINGAVDFIMSGGLEALATPTRVRRVAKKTVVGPVCLTTTMPTKLVSTRAIEREMVISSTAKTDLAALVLLSVNTMGGSLNVAFWFVMESGHGKAMRWWNRKGIGRR